MSLITRWIISYGILESITILLVLANALTFALYAVDKRSAQKGRWRISERALFFFTLSFGGFGALLGMRCFRHKTRKTKFKLVVIISVIISLIPTVHIVHGLTLSKAVRFIEINFYSEYWSTELSGYRLAFMSDFHTITDAEMRSVISELNKRNIDLLLLGGDFSMENAHYQGTLFEISQAITTDGIFGVEGNHDDYVRLFAAMERRGIIPLDNNGLYIREGFYLSGVQDMWNRSPSIEDAVRNADTDDFILLISHNPDVSMEQSTSGVDLILSGHTHNGQITFFGYPFYLNRRSITSYGTRFSYGFSYSSDGVPVFVSGGVGAYYAIPRIFTRPDVVILSLYNSHTYT